MDIEKISALNQIPFLPIGFFKSNKITASEFLPEVTFESSGTSKHQTSKHFVKDASIYTRSFTKGFQKFYGEIEDYCVIGLLPSYLERSGSSLIVMVDHLIKLSKHPLSNFYLYNFAKLAKVLQALEQQQKKTILIGVTFALLDFAQQYPMQLKNTVVMETGGMKGRKREMIRDEVHAFLKERLGLRSVHSEYGMTELLSQAYSTREGKFSTVPWMKVLVRGEDDPMKVTANGRGLINVVDLANIHSCSFIATEDVGIIDADGTFEVIGRMDTSDIRGCNLMIV